MNEAGAVKVTGLDHVNIRTYDVPASAQFYADVLGLEPRSPPVALPPEKSRWLCDTSGQAVIHLFNAEHTQGSTGPIDHVALRCSGKAALIARLEARGLAYDVFQASPEHTLLFTRDPHGVLLELNFHGE